MSSAGGHALASAAGTLAVVAWGGYVLAAAIHFGADFPPSVLAAGACGVFACLTLVLDYTRWRVVVILASAVYLVLYAVRVGRMLGMTGDALSALPSTLQFYYTSSWRVTLGLMEERGTAASLAHGYLEYVMPLLAVLVIVLALVPRRVSGRHHQRSGITRSA